MASRHYIYEVTDPVTGEFYIGVRSCDCEPKDDVYMGSPCRWTPENESRLEKQVLFECDSRKEANYCESKLIEACIECEQNRNYHIPAKGFHLFGIRGEQHPAYGRILSEEEKQEISERMKEWYSQNNHPLKGVTGEDHYNFGSKRNKEFRERRSKRYLGEGNPFFGKQHSEEVRSNISESLSGENHPNYGKNRPNQSEVAKKLTKNGRIKAKKVIHIPTSTVYESLNKASKGTGYSAGTICGHCKGRYKTQKFKYLKE